MSKQSSSAEPHSALEWVPEHPTLPKLIQAASGCQGCELFRNATQTVFGEGPADARIVMVGEQPGDQEDRAGKPFVGPAGRLLDQALADAGIRRDVVYVTNAVKHFKFVEKGKRRIHAKPGAREVLACMPWLEAEIAVIRPELIVCLGATAAQALMGRNFRLTEHRGTYFEHPWARRLMATVHPSALLRAPDRERAQQEYLRFVEDLTGVPRYLASTARP